MQHLIVLGHCHTENDSRHIFEAMYPLFPLRSLAANVEQSAQITYNTIQTISYKICCTRILEVGNSLEVQIFEGEMHFNDASGFHASPQDVLFGGLVILSA